ncbi:MAG: ABC transporter ATP-binding protein [Clostridia bacterium]|jgi:branched-chain amino acid transport system ATP-binding protein|nr:ABC transporter ATP-binding protein [Clostridia bacterium]
MLSVKNLHVSYGGIHAIKGISFTVNEGEIVTLIGANGAGKTTTLHTISGLKTPTQGKITYNGINLRKTEPSQIITLGMAHVPEGRHVFGRMTVAENLKMGAFTIKSKEVVQETMEKVYTRFPRLKERHRQLAGTLSGGEQQMLAIGRALMGNPKTLLLDEPSMGLSPILVHEVFQIISELHAGGITILLVEQNARMALSIADRAYVLETGTIAMEGDAKALMEDDRVRQAYLGA